MTELITCIYFEISEFNLTFEVQDMGNEAFQNASFVNALFENEALSYSCLLAKKAMK